MFRLHSTDLVRLRCRNLKIAQVGLRSPHTPEAGFWPGEPKITGRGDSSPYSRCAAKMRNQDGIRRPANQNVRPVPWAVQRQSGCVWLQSAGNADDLRPAT